MTLKSKKNRSVRQGWDAGIIGLWLGGAISMVHRELRNTFDVCVSHLYLENGSNDFSETFHDD